MNANEIKTDPEYNIPQTCEKEETRVYRLTVNQAVEENWFQQDTVNSSQTCNEILQDSKPPERNIIVTEATVELPPKHIRAELGDSDNRMDEIINQFKIQNSGWQDINPLEAIINNVATEAEDIISVMIENQEPAIENKHQNTKQYEMDW
ncbi:hypothetical protein CBL_06998 [Carabus blaptoides fortunei]